MSDFDNLVSDFRNNMALTATFVGGNAFTDIQTASGPIPTLAKLIRTSDERLKALVPTLEERLRLDGDGQYNINQQAWGRKNLGLDKVDNVADVDKPLSKAQQSAIQQVLSVMSAKQDTSERNKVGGYFAYDGAKLPIRNGADKLFGYLYHNATVPRNWQLPDKDGTVALKEDITGTNSGVNTGDETTTTIKTKLGIEVLSGKNTGDETKTTLLSKLEITALSGKNTGDETRATIVQKLGYDPLNSGAVGVADGVAPLDEAGLIPREFLPSSFEAIELAANLGVLPAVGTAKRLYITLNDHGMYYWADAQYWQLNIRMNNTNNLAEGTDNLYFTQLRAISSLLSTYKVEAAADVATTDTVVKAIAKIQAQVKASIADYTTKLATKEDVANRATSLNSANNTTYPTTLAVKTAVDAKEATANKATDFTVVNHTKYPTVQAAKAYIDALMVGVVSDRGNYNASTNQFPTTGGTGDNGAIRKGNLWYVSAAGQLGGVAVNVGDSFRALVDNPGQDAANWGVLESNLGYVPYNATNPAGYISGITYNMVVAALNFTPANQAHKDASSGYAGLTQFKINFKNAAGTFTSFFTNANTAARTYTYPDKSGTVALLSDLENTSTGTNTGDETKASIQTKLGDSLELVGTTPQVKYIDGDESLVSGAWRTVLEGGRWRLDVNKAAARDFSTFASPISADAAGVEVAGTLTVKGALNGARANDLLSATSLNLNSMTGNFGHLTGLANVMTIILAEGAIRTLRIMGSIQFIAGARLLLPHSRISARQDDIMVFQGMADGVVRCLHHITPGYHARPETVTSASSSTGTATLDLSLAAVFEVTIQANTAFVFDFSKVPPLNNQMFSFVLVTTNDGVAGRGVSFPANVKWAGGVMPTRTTAANARDDWYFYTRDGTNWIGSLSNQDIK